MDNKKNTARIITTLYCKRKCLLCCNNNIDFSLIPKIKEKEINNLSIKNIVITGGEPILFPNKLFNVINKQIDRKKFKIYLYASDITETYNNLYNLFFTINGLTFTLYNQKDAYNFYKLYLEVLKFQDIIQENKFSLKLKIFKNDITYLSHLKFLENFWDIEYIKWTKFCPLPENENLFILNKLWSKK